MKISEFEEGKKYLDKDSNEWKFKSRAIDWNYLENPEGEIRAFTQKGVDNMGFKPVPKEVKSLTPEEAKQYLFTDRELWFWNKSEPKLVKGQLTGLSMFENYFENSDKGWYDSCSLEDLGGANEGYKTKGY